MTMGLSGGCFSRGRERLPELDLNGAGVDNRADRVLRAKYLFAIMIIVTLWGAWDRLLAMLAGILNVNHRSTRSGLYRRDEQPLPGIIYITIPAETADVIRSRVAIVNAFSAGMIGVELSG